MLHDEEPTPLDLEACSRLLKAQANGNLKERRSIGQDPGTSLEGLDWDNLLVKPSFYRQGSSYDRMEGGIY